MNTCPNKGISVSTVAVRALATAAALVAIRVIAETQDASKTHTLFMGADVYVGTDKDVHAVRDVDGTSWVVDVNGKPEAIRADGALTIKITSKLKLTAVSATVTGLKSERSYTPNNDPSAMLAKALVIAEDNYSGNQAAVNLANANVAHRMQVASYINGMTGGGGAAGTETAEVRAAKADAARQAVSAGADNELYGDRGVPSGYDALDVTFEVSSERPLNNPYVVTVTRFHPSESDPGHLQTLIYAKALNPIDAHAQSVHLTEGGFPAGFGVQDFQVHLYNRGEEVATTVSARRVPLTRDEAFEYVRMEYLAAHKGETLQPTPAMGRLPSDLPKLLAEGKYRETYYVRVSRDGLGGEPFLDPSCTRRADDPYLQSVVRSIRFKPALENGTPVEGVAPLNLGQLAI